MPTTPNATQRFSNRVENYIRYRPRYPDQTASLLQANCGLTRESTIADVGSGTGILSELFMAHGARVFGVEPNREMREAAERLLGSHSSFTSIAGCAEATTLPAQCVDIVAAGQAFHWFDRDRSRAEFGRILRTGGWVILIWNDRRTESTPFLQGYEHLLHDFATDYAQVDHKRIDETVLRDFYRGPITRETIAYCQHFDFEGLRGRLLSSSYAPEKGDPGHEQMLQALAKLFQEHQEGGRVTFEYDTLIYYGRLG